MNHEATPSVPDDESVDGEFWDKTAKTPSEQNLKGDQSGIGHFDTRAQESHDEWPEIIDIDETPLPSLDWDLLPDWYGDMVRAVAEATETPMEMPALTVLGALATANQKKYEIEVEGDYSQPLNLYTILVSDPGNRKSSVFKQLFRPVFDYQSELLQGWDREYKAATKAHDDWKRQQAALIRDAGGKEKQGAERGMVNEPVSEPGLPSRPQIIVDDATPESLIGILAQNHQRLTLAGSEPDVFDQMLGRYSKKPNLGIYLKGHEGDPFSENRKNGQPMHLQCPLITVSVMAQNVAIREVTANPLCVGRGLLARFLYLKPKSNVGNRQCTRTSIPGNIASEYHSRLTQLLSASIPRTPEMLKFSPAAFHRWKEKERQIEHLMREGELLQDHRGWGGKFPAAIARVAANLHVASCVGDRGNPARCEVSLDTMETTIRFCEVVMHHTLAVFNACDVVPERKVARSLLAKIRRAEKLEWTLRDLKRLVRSDADGQHFEKAIRLLINSGYMRKRPPLPGQGRPSETCVLNPATMAHRHANPTGVDL